MLFETFKAKVATTLAMDSNSGKFRQQTSQQEYSFSKTRILYPKKFEGTQQDFFVSQDILRDKDKYELIKLYKYDDIDQWTKDSKFQAKFEGGAKLNLIVDFWNGIKLRIIHKRYWPQRNADWIFKAIITTAMGAIIALYADKRGFNEGYQQGLKEGISHIQVGRPR